MVLQLYIILQRVSLFCAIFGIYSFIVDNWYENIKEMSLYDTGVTAQMEDEFITLSCCSYPVEDGWFVVLGKCV